MSNSNIYVMEDDETSGSEEISDSEIDSFLLDKDLVENALAVPPQEFLFAPQAMSESVILPDLACLDQETQDRLQALLQAAGITKVANENRSYGDPEILKRLSSSVSSALDEAAAALTRMKNDDKSVEDPSGAVVTEIAGAEEGESLLSLACSAGYYELAQVLLAMRTNVEDRGSKGDCTPLMEAASAGHADIVKLLIAHGADMTAQSSTGNTPLMYACASGHEEVVRVLLKAGADVSLHNENGHTPLMEAASAGHVGIAKLLVEHGAQVNAHSTEFKVGLESPLTLACYKGHLEMVRYLLQVGGDNQSPGRQEELHTALMEASMDGHVEVARLLLDAGAQVNLPTDSFESPLTLAACGGHTELATLLLERGANLEEPNDEGYTPLMEAAREGHEETVTVLLDWGAFVNAQTEETGETALTLACCGGFQEVSVLLLNHDGDIELGANTPLMEAAQEGHVDLVRYLMKRGANVNASTASGDTPLTYAAENGHTDVCTAILDGGALLEQVAEGGRTALMKAGRAGHLCTVQYLLSKGADPNKTTSSNDHCALSLACGGGHLTVVDLLLQHGADPSVKLKDGATCIMEAAKGGHTAVVQLLIDWPGQQMSLAAAAGLQLPIDQNSAHNIVPPPPPNLNLPSCAEAGNAALMSNHSMSSLANVLPQFLLPTTVSSSVGANYGNLSFGYATGLNVNVGLGVGQNQQQSLASETSFLAYKDPLTQAEKALLKQASEKLSAAELQQLQELLKAQFQETAAQLANRVQSTNAGNNNSTSVAAASASTTRTSVGASSLPANHSASNSSSAKSKKAELEAAMKELEQLKKTQQLYEQLQRALEQKDEKSIANKQSSKSKMKSVQQQQPLPAVNSSSRKDSSCFALPVVPPPSPPPPPPPPPLQQQFFSQSTPVLPQSNVSQQQQMVSFQLPALDPAQLQYLQQQFSLALSAQNFQFQLQQQNSGNPSTCSLPTTPSLLFPSLPPNNGNTVSVVSNADGTSALAQIQLPATNDSSPSLLPLPPGHNNAVQQQSHSSANIYVPLPLQLPVAAASADVSAQQQQQPSENSQQTNAFNFQLPPSGFNFTPAAAHLISTPANVVGINQQQQGATAMLLNNVAPHVAYANFGAVSTNVVVAGATAKSTQTNFGIVEQQQTATPITLADVYHPQVGAFQPTSAYSLTANFLNQTAVALAGGVGLQQQQQQQQTQQQPAVVVAQQQQLVKPGVDLNTQTESNHDTALTLACAGGHEELVMLLLQRGADLEHQDKKGFTPLILAATAGHAGVVELLLDHGASPEAQSERTKDTALSLACSSGKKEVVEILLKRATNKEHRNVSDYTPLSLAASGGYTEIINLLLQYGAEINSRTGSKLGISPLMLAAMNGHVQAVKLLLEKGADINAQIETNRNTALTLACFQGRNEVVKLLLEYGANVEHRAKTGLTPLMEAASGGYVEVGRVLLHYGADPNCAPVPASRDTALTVAADKGHTKFVELLLQHGAQLDCKTKKGCTALWLACHGGYLEVVQALVKSNANVDAQDNRKVTPLMAAFRKGHLKVVKWLVRHVQQFPSDTECTRYLATILDKDTSVKCKQCMETIMAAKDRQAQEANKAAAVLLQELEHEQQLAETRRQAKQRQKEKKKAKRKAKKASQKGDDDDVDADKDQECNSDAILKEKTNIDEDEDDKNLRTEIASSKDNSPDATKDSAASSQPCSSRSSASGGSLERYQKHRRRTSSPIAHHPMIGIDDSQPVMPVAEFIKVAELDERKRVPAFCSDKTDATDYDFQQALTRGGNNNNAECARRRRRPRRVRPTDYSKQDPSDVIKSMTVISTAHQHRYAVDGSKNLTKLRSNNNAVDSTKHVDYSSDADGWSKATTHKTLANVTQPTNVVRSRGRSMGSNRVSATTARVDENTPVNTNGSNNAGNAANANNNATNVSHFRNETKRQSQRIYVSSQSIARVIGRGGNNINAIRESSGAHIEVEKQQKGQTDRLITIRGSSDSTKQAILMINGLINEPETPVQEIVSKVKRKDMKAMENFSHARGSTGYTMGSTDIVTVAAGATPLALKMYPGQTSEKTNGFPEMTFWSPSTVPVTKHNKSGVRDPSAIKSAIPVSSTPTTTCSYTTATALSKATTVVSSSKLPKSDVTVISGAKPASAITPPTASQSMNMEYSPFSTPNVWFSRSSNVPQKMNFASVAAANIVTTSNAASTTTTVSTRNNPIPYPAAVVSYAAPPPPPPLPIQQQQPKQTADLSFDTDGRRSAGISSGYFSPISLPRPASATACVNVPLEQGTPPSPVSSTMFSLGNQQFHNIMLPTPIGGERRSRGPSTVPTALANVFGDYIDQQQNWDAGNRSNLDGNDWSSGFSGLSANLAQLQALQAMDVNASLMQNDYSAPYGANSCMSNETPLPNDNMMPSGNQMYDREFYQSAMWLAAYHQQQQQQQHLPTAPHQHQQQQQHRFVMPPPPSFSEPPPSAMSMYGNANFNVPADPWIGQQPTNANSWKYVNGNAATASSSGLLDYHATSATTNHVHSQHVVGHPPPPNLPMNHYRTTATQQSQQQQQQQRQLQQQQQQLQQHGWSGWNSSLTMQ